MMICWPDVWEHLKQKLPLIEICASLIAYSALIGLLLWAPKLRKPWQKITSRVIGGIGLVPLAVFSFTFSFGFMLNAGNPPTKSLTVKSPNGAEATMNYEAGFLGRDFTEVLLQTNDCCRHRQVFWYDGPGYFNNTQIHWEDPHHLQIVYHARTSDVVHCEANFGDIAVTCTKILWPEAPTSDVPNEHSDHPVRK